MISLLKMLSFRGSCCFRHLSILLFCCWYLRSFCLVLHVPELNSPFPFILAYKPHNYFLCASSPYNTFLMQSKGNQHSLLLTSFPGPSSGAAILLGVRSASHSVTGTVLYISHLCPPSTPPPAHGHPVTLVTRLLGGYWAGGLGLTLPRLDQAH